MAACCLAITFPSLVFVSAACLLVIREDLFGCAWCLTTEEAPVDDDDATVAVPRPSLAVAVCWLVEMLVFEHPVEQVEEDFRDENDDVEDDDGEADSAEVCADE